MSITESARQFVDACDSGRGWKECAQYCHDGASFSVQADALAEIATVEGYVGWARDLLTPIPDASYELNANNAGEVVANLEKYTSEISQALNLEEKAILEKFTSSVEDFQALDEEIAQCDDTLSQIESILEGFQGSLSGISHEIQTLQGDSMAMNMKVTLNSPQWQ